MYKGKFEELTEATITRFQLGGLLPGDVVKVSKNALSHPALKNATKDMKGAINELIQYPGNIRVKAIKSTRPSNGDNANGLGFGTTSAPTDFWADVAPEYAPGLTTDPVTLPVEVLERQDFGPNLPTLPDHTRYKNKVIIKPEDASKYNKDPNNLEEAYDAVWDNKTKEAQYEIIVPNVYANTVKEYLTQEGVSFTTKSGEKTFITVTSKANELMIEQDLRKNAIGPLVYLQVKKTTSNITEN